MSHEDAGEDSTKLVTALKRNGQIRLFDKDDLGISSVNPDENADKLVDFMQHLSSLLILCTDGFEKLLTEQIEEPEVKIFASGEEVCTNFQKLRDRIDAEGLSSNILILLLPEHSKKKKTLIDKGFIAENILELPKDGPTNLTGPLHDYWVDHDIVRSLVVQSGKGRLCTQTSVDN